MKKLLLSATACLTMAVSGNAQQIQPCGTYQAREIHLKNLPGYAAKLNAAIAASDAEYQAFLQNAATSRTVAPNYTFTVPVVFHVLHLGEDVGTGTNVADAELISALDQVNRDFAREGADTANIDQLFKPLYVNSNMHFQLAKKDPQGNCTNGIVRHYDEKTNWSQEDLFNYQYSTMAAGSWNPSKYLNIYIVKNIIGSSIGIIVGYTYLPGTSPIDPADAIVYRNDFLTGGLNARSLSHEIGHWFGLAHTFGSTNDPGSECGNDDIADTPPTTGFFSTCPKAANYSVVPTVTNPVDSSDILKFSFGNPAGTYRLLTCNTALNSLTGAIIKPLYAMTATTVSPTADTLAFAANGTAGGYSDFSGIYGNDFNGGSTNTITVQSMAASIDNNYVTIYFDKNRDGDFIDAGETIYTSPAGLFGSQTYTASYTLPTGMYGIYRMRVITSNAPITGPTMTPASGEIEDYNFNIGTTPGSLIMASCSDIRPNIENIMDYSSCPKMFTVGQRDKMRTSALSSISSRDSLCGVANLIFTGIIDAAGNPTPNTPCAPIADFAANNFITCAGQALTFNSTSYNSSAPMTYLWEFEGGSPSTSTLATQSVTYATPGTYSVSLTVTNADGTSTKSVNNYVTTNWNAAQITLPYVETFENQWWPAGFNFVNEDSGTPGWELSNYGKGSSKSTVLANANYVPTSWPGFASNVDIMELPPFDFSNTTNISLSFDYSFARKTDVVADTFKVQYSLDCGGSWKTLSGITAAQMATSGGTVNAPYIPWSSVPDQKWATKAFSTILLNPVANKRDVKFRFWFQNDVSTGESQNLYIDNINVSGTVGIDEFENSLGLAIYPNPTSSSANVEFTSPSSSNVEITVFDVTGRVVEKSELNGMAGITMKHTINSSNHLNSGIYFISINIDGRKVTKKLIIE